MVGHTIRMINWSNVGTVLLLYSVDWGSTVTLSAT
jgi:hypothetical protein